MFKVDIICVRILLILDCLYFVVYNINILIINNLIVYIFCGVVGYYGV